MCPPGGQVARSTLTAAFATLIRPPPPLSRWRIVAASKDHPALTRLH